MDPPTLNKNPWTGYMDRFSAELLKDVENEMVGVYFRAYGFTDYTINPSAWEEPQWTLQDFANFYSCPAMVQAVSWYDKIYLSKNPLVMIQPWHAVAAVIQETFRHEPAKAAIYMSLHGNIMPNPRPIDYALTFILSLLHYRNHIHDETPATRDDFQTRQATYAQSFGRNNPFYRQWNGSDKWTCAFLLYLALYHRHNQYTEMYMKNTDDVTFCDEYERAYGASQTQKIDLSTVWLHEDAAAEYAKRKGRLVGNVVTQISQKKNTKVKSTPQAPKAERGKVTLSMLAKHVGSYLRDIEVPWISL
ncbi:uncharacterized protein F4822DRAFT_440242 [Hypoxylon trugodes]|uniref:uncharacterized protein n=1 Tax=Hypoxylon trugodes TaxID=326681 RepID=UPI00218F41B7|nr:uncharacterized protein F4822DRAFT_440242 [Hypoxylon trugodes]KAI1384075.1 hypothetical protein F4822DRAFT_440242 [Hypoxylon trugodes]